MLKSVGTISSHFHSGRPDAMDGTFLSSFVTGAGVINNELYNRPLQ